MAEETHEQRIARLTELAKKAAPRAYHVEIDVERRSSDSLDVEVRAFYEMTVDVVLAMTCESPRALAALEAALCALAGEPPQWAVELANAWIARAPAGTMSEQFAEDRADELLEAAKRTTP